MTRRDAEPIPIFGMDTDKLARQLESPSQLLLQQEVVQPVDTLNQSAPFGFGQVALDHSSHLCGDASHAVGLLVAHEHTA